MRLIDANKLYKHKFESASERMDLNVAYMGGWNDAIDSIVENAPTVDAVEVVRCKECKWHEYEEIGMVWCPNMVGSLGGEDGYCSWGERKDEVTE